MDIATLAAFADILTTLGVLVSVIFVWVELKRSNRENRLGNWFHATGRLNDYRENLTDPALNALILRGRKDINALKPEEAEAFKHHLLQNQLAAQTFIRLQGLGIEPTKVSIRAFRKIVLEAWDHPGPRAWWTEIRADPPVVPTVAALIDEILGYPAMERPVE